MLQPVSEHDDSEHICERRHPPGATKIGKKSVNASSVTWRAKARQRAIQAHPKFEVGDLLITPGFISPLAIAPLESLLVKSYYSPR